MTDFITKKQELYRYFPRPFYRLVPGKGLGVLLDAFGDELELVTVQMANYRQQFLLHTALGVYLNLQGFNRDVYRPIGFNMTDSTYRGLIEIITNSGKNRELIFEQIIALFFGADAQEKGIAQVYAVGPNKIYLSIQQQALIIASSRDLYGTAYLHYDSDNAYTGLPNLSWTSALTGPVSNGTTIIPMVIPGNMPPYGNIRFGTTAPPSGTIETKKYRIVLGQVELLSPLNGGYPTGLTLTGPETPDNFPSMYIYDKDRQTDLVGSEPAGTTTIQVGVNLQNLPLNGVIYIGDPLSAEFEAKAFSRANLGDPNLVLEGPTAFNHSSGEPVQIPNMPRQIRTILNQTITAGQSFSDLTVINSADFPIERQAIFIGYSLDNQETVPFITRTIADNTLMEIDPAYVFKQDHAIGEQINLCSRKTQPAQDGTDWAFFINDTVSLRNRFFDIIDRIKAVGMKLEIEIVAN